MSQLFFAVSVLSAPAVAQYYTAQIGPDESLFETAASSLACSNAPTQYSYGSGSATYPPTGALPGPLVLWTVGGSGYPLGSQFAQVNGTWRPATVSNSSSPPGSSYYTTTLDASGKLKTYVFTAFADASSPTPLILFTATETIDLQTGKWSESYQQVVTYNGNGVMGVAPCGLGVWGVYTDNVQIDGSLEITLVPVPIQLSLATLNPYSCILQNNSCTAVPSGVLGALNPVTSAPAASAISADGRSAAVIVISSNDPANSVQLTLSGPPDFSGALGSLSLYDPNFLDEGASGSTTLTIPANQGSNSNYSYCDPSFNCVYLALLWAPAGMSGGMTSSVTGAFVPVPLTITATQGGSSPVQADIQLQPPPLVLVHGIWSNAKAWTPFEDWLITNYPHDLFFPADYGQYNYLAFSDFHIQSILEQAVSDALASANQRVIARQVDVVAHSMGGLVTRYFINNGPPYSLSYLLPNPVHQLITIGTPQVGSPLATILSQNSGKLANPNRCPIPSVICPLCTLGMFMELMGNRVDTGVQSLQSGILPSSTEVYDSILGQAPESSSPPLAASTTENWLDCLLAAFGTGQTDYGALGGYPNDTIVPGSSQTKGAIYTATVTGVVHSPICAIVGLTCSDTGEIASQDVWTKATSWLMGTGSANLLSHRAAAPLAKRSLPVRQGTSASTTLPALDLTGYTQVPSSNVTFSPATGSVLTIGSSANITATSSTKTVTEILLFQNVSDPTDVPLIYSIQSPFSIAFTPSRMGSTSFTGFAVFSDMTYAVMTLSYSFQPLANPLALSLVNAPVASLPVGSSAVVHAQALFSSGPVDVTQVAIFSPRSGTNSVFSVDSTGTVTAKGPGVDWLDVSYNGVSADAQIAVGSCTYSLSPSNQLVSLNGGQIPIQVMTQPGCSWSVDTGGAGWLTPTNASGSGSGTITLTATPNTTGYARTTIITVANQDAAVVQPAVACSYAVSQTQVSLPPTGGSGTIGVMTSCPILVSSDATWLTAVVLSGSVGYSAPANRSGAARSATIAVETQSVHVSQAVATLTTTLLMSSTSSINSGQSVNLTASVTPESASGAPTGLVSFLDNEGSTSLGSGTLNSSGVAILTISNLTTPGLHSITAVYGGDANYLGSASSAATVTVNAATFTFAASPASETITNGASASYTLTATPNGSYTSQISFSCAFSPSSSATCSANPVTPGANQTTTTLTISGAKPAAALDRGSRLAPPLYGYWLLMTAAGAISMGGRKRGKAQSLRLFLRIGALAIVGVAMFGCGGSSPSSTQAKPHSQTYQVTITAMAAATESGSSAAVSTTQTVSLTVNP